MKRTDSIRQSLTSKANEIGKSRTAQFRHELREKAGGMFLLADVAGLLGTTPAAVEKLRQEGKLLSVCDGDEVRFPVAQFKDGAIVPGLEAVLAAFGDMNPWGQLQLLVAPLEGFHEEPAGILDLLAGEIDEATYDQLVRLVRGWSA